MLYTSSLNTAHIMEPHCIVPLERENVIAEYLSKTFLLDVLHEEETSGQSRRAAK